MNVFRLRLRSPGLGVLIFALLANASPVHATSSSIYRMERAPTVAMSCMKEALARELELATEFRFKAHTEEWIIAPGTYDRYKGFIPRNPKAFDGRKISGYLVENGEAKPFEYDVVTTFVDKNKPDVVQAIVRAIDEDGKEIRKMVPLTGAKMVLIKSDPSLPPVAEVAPKTEKTFGRADALRLNRQATELPVHDTSKGQVLPTILEDGTVLMPPGVWSLKGRSKSVPDIVQVPASAYKAPAKGRVEADSLRALESQGFSIVKPLQSGGLRHTYLIERNGKKFIAKVFDPNKLVPAIMNVNNVGEEAAIYLANVMVAKLCNREPAMRPSIAKHGLDPLSPLDLPDLQVRGTFVYEYSGEMSMGEAIAKYPELADAPEVTQRHEAIAEYEDSYRDEVTIGYYGLFMRYARKSVNHPEDGQPLIIGIDLKADAHHESDRLDNTRVKLRRDAPQYRGGKILPGKMRIQEAKETDW